MMKRLRLPGRHQIPLLQELRMAGGASTFRTKPPDPQSALHLVEKIIMGKREKSKREKLEKIGKDLEKIGKGKEGKSDSEIVFFFFFF